MNRYLATEQVVVGNRADLTDLPLNEALTDTLKFRIKTKLKIILNTGHNVITGRQYIEMKAMTLVFALRPVSMLSYLVASSVALTLIFFNCCL